MKKMFVLMGLLVAVSAPAAPKTAVIHQPGKYMGACPVPESYNRWRSLSIRATADPTEADYALPDELDFFRLEYGRAFAPTNFSVPAKGAWKTAFENVRLCRGWGGSMLGRAQLVMEVEQDVPETKWQFFGYGTRDRGTKDFTVSGVGVQSISVELGMVKNVNGYDSIALSCLTPGATGRIRSLKITLRKLPVEWRRTFVVAEKPARVGVSSCSGRVTMNGHPVFPHLPPGEGGVRRADVTDFVRVGTNEIVIAGEYNSGYGIPGRILNLSEAFYVSPDGVTHSLGPDANWEWRYAAGTNGWRKVACGGRNGIELLANRTKVLQRGGYIPMHAGPLDVTPATDDGYPLFDEDAPATWNVRVFGQVKDPVVKAVVKDAFTGKPVKELEIRVGVRERNLTTCAAAPLNERTGNTPLSNSNSNSNSSFIICGLKPGAYEIAWSLTSNGKQLDVERTELIVLGRIAQDEFAYADFERELESRLELIQEIDCTKEEKNPTNFLDHTGMEAKSAQNVGGVETIGPYRVRVTGKSRRDFFAYRIDIAGLGEPHIVELTYPDVDDRVACTSVSVTYPNDYAHNASPFGSTAWSLATGSVRTGGILPTSGKLKTMRTVFFPGSSNITYSVENGQRGPGAAAVAIRVYRVKGGLPALKIPETHRTYANHCERPLFAQWGTQFNPRLSDYWHGDFERCWAAAYAAAANRVRYLRYAGHNAAVEGVFMYKQGFATESGQSLSNDTSFDLFWIAARLYAKNGIKVYPCVEYVNAPGVERLPSCGVSNREIAEGTARGVYHVDAQGRQRMSIMNSGLNFLAPDVWNAITNLVGDIYRRYSSLPNVEGLFTVNGMWWQPGYPYWGNFDMLDVGFDDDSIEAFERETGIRLGTGTTGVGRFAKRAELLKGKYRTAWLDWRSANLRRHLDEMADLLKGGKHDWTLFPTPHLNYETANPFSRVDAAKSDRDGYQAKRMRDAGFDPALYAGASGDVRLVPEVHYLHCLEVGRYGGMLCEGSKRLYDSLDAVYLSCVGLDEHFNQNSEGVPAWWWWHLPVAAYDVKPSGHDAFYDFVDILSATTPRRMFHTWLDCNLTTAHTEESRRFVTGFYATPDGVKLADSDAVKGVTARVSDGVLQLVNATPYPITGKLRIRGSVEDAVTCRVYDGGWFGKTFDYRLEAWGVTVMKGEAAHKITGELRFDAADAKTVRAEADKILGNAELAAAIDAGTVARLAAARRTGDDYAAARLLRDPEVLEPTMRYAKAEDGRARQAQLLEMLRKDGIARIDCGSPTDTTDELGRRWLADQTYTGFGSYGNQFGRFANRGPIGIRNTKIPSVYRTESGGAGALYYTFPVPNGTYDVVLHFAETWDNHPGRKVLADVNGDTRDIKIWERSGWKNAAMFETYENIKAENGFLKVTITGQPIINAIEIKVRK